MISIKIISLHPCVILLRNPDIGMDTASTAL